MEAVHEDLGVLWYEIHMCSDRVLTLRFCAILQNDEDDDMVEISILSHLKASLFLIAESASPQHQLIRARGRYLNSSGHRFVFCRHWQQGDVVVSRYTLAIYQRTTMRASLLLIFDLFQLANFVDDIGTYYIRGSIVLWLARLY